MERDNDIYRIIGQLEATITNIVNADKDCRARQTKEHDQIFDLISELRKEIADSKAFVIVKINDQYSLLTNQLDTKCTKEEATKIATNLAADITKIKEVLNLDNSNTIKNNLGIVNNAITTVLSIAGGIGLILAGIELFKLVSTHGK